jgi:hypothetical protein
VYFTPKNWARKQIVRTWYKGGGKGSGTEYVTIRFAAVSKDRIYNRIRARGIRVKITDNNIVGGAHRAATRATARKALAPLVAAALPKLAPDTAMAALPPEATFDPATLVNTAFDQAWATYSNGTTLKGGVIQITKLAKASEGGFANADYAAKLVRTSRHRDLAKWTSDTRWLVMLGADRRYYVYEAKLVTGVTSTPLANAIQMYVFSKSAAAWRDEVGNWRAGADTAIS